MVIFYFIWTMTEITTNWFYRILVSDLTPNIGLFWYFFMEVFTHFRTFFAFVFQAHAFIYTIPLALQFGYVWEKSDLFTLIFCFCICLCFINYLELLFFFKKKQSEHPIFLFFIQSGIVAIFKSYPSLSDVSFVLCFALLYKYLYKCKWRKTSWIFLL